MWIYFLILLPAIIAVVLVLVLQYRRDPFKPILSNNLERPLIPVTEPVALPAFEPMEAGTMGPDNNASVLIVDDQSAIRMLLREMFELEGITVYEAPHGLAAIELIRRVKVDFILLDLKMPDMDGIEALRFIREIDRNVEVAMITAYGDPDKLEDAKQLGVLTSFTKPFDIDIVRQFVLSRMKESKEASLQKN